MDLLDEFFVKGSCVSGVARSEWSGVSSSQEEKSEAEADNEDKASAKLLSGLSRQDVMDFPADSFLQPEGHDDFLDDDFMTLGQIRQQQLAVQSTSQSLPDQGFVIQQQPMYSQSNGTHEYAQTYAATTSEAQQNNVYQQETAPQQYFVIQQQNGVGEGVYMQHYAQPVQMVYAQAESAGGDMTMMDHGYSQTANGGYQQVQQQHAMQQQQHQQHDQQQRYMIRQSMQAQPQQTVYVQQHDYGQLPMEGEMYMDTTTGETVIVQHRPGVGGAQASTSQMYHQTLDPHQQQHQQPTVMQAGGVGGQRAQQGQAHHSYLHQHAMQPQHRMHPQSVRVMSTPQQPHLPYTAGGGQAGELGRRRVIMSNGVRMQHGLPPVGGGGGAGAAGVGATGIPAGVVSVQRMSWNEQLQGQGSPGQSPGGGGGGSGQSTPSGSAEKLTTTQRKPPPRRRVERVEPMEIDGAQLAAVQRIGTEEGWKQMNSWLKMADKAGNLKRIRTLLQQCAQAKVTVDLLTSNDTPKFVRRLSKSSEDAELKRVASEVVAKWKLEVAQNPKPEVKKEKKDKADKKHKEESDTEMDEKIREKEKAREERERREKEAKEEERRKRKDRPKTARVYTQKPRSTGLEGDDHSPVEKKRKESKDDDGKKSKKEEKKVDEPPKKKVTPPAKKPAVVMMSNGFMDALASTAVEKKKVIPKRRPVEKKPEKKAEPVLNSGATPQVLDGLFSEQSRPAEEGGDSAHSSKSPSPPEDKRGGGEGERAASGAGIVHDVEEPNMAPAGKRRIRFADEFGGQLVHIQHFEIEEGERINVNRFTPEDMKHHEMIMEKKFHEQHRGGAMEEEEEREEKEEREREERARKKSEVKWRLHPLEGVHYLVEPGSKSQAKLDELARQEKALKAFVDPNVACSRLDEPDDWDPLAARQPPNMIPLEAADEPSHVSAAVVPAPAPAAASTSSLPPELQKLMDGLRNKGIVGGGPTPAPAAAPTASGATSLAQLVPSLAAAGIISSSAAPVASSYAQMPSYGQIGMGVAGAGGHPAVIEQHFPAPSSVAAGSGLQLLSNVDVHAPNPAAAPIIGSGGFRGAPMPQGPRMCQFFLTAQGCNFGVRCRFSHGDQPTQGRDRDAGGWRGGRGGFRGGGRGGFRGGRDRDERGRGRFEERWDRSGESARDAAGASPRDPPHQSPLS